MERITPKSRLRKIILFILGVFLSLFHLYSGGYQPLVAQTQRCVHVGIGLAMIFILFPSKKQEDGDENKLFLFTDVLFSILSIVCVGYFSVSLDSLAYRLGCPSMADILISTIGIMLLLEACRRLLGLALPIISVGFLLYALFGPYFPGILKHRGCDFKWLITHIFLSTEGVFGIPVGVSATYVFLFVLFAVGLEKTGGGQFFLDLAYSLFGRYRGGPAKVAVVASALMGTISGSAVANVAGTGCITIPLMKKTGYDAKSAGAIEAVASSGGLIMPPIMGAAAFVMSEFLGIPYLKIIVAAAIPAVLYYVAVFAAVDFKAGSMGLKGLKAEELPVFREIMKKGFQFIIPLVVLIFCLVVILSTPQKAAFLGFISIILIYIFTLLKNKDYKELKKILLILVEGSKGALPIIVACACAGIVIGVISLTGVGFMLSGALLEIGGQNMFLLLFITMCSSLILGMGLPVTACYIILAVLSAPSLVKLGVNPIAAHLFVIYFGVLSGITPPVALAAYVASGIAEDKPMSVAVEACKIGIVAFILPYMFIYNPVLLIQDVTAVSMITAIITGLIGSIMIAAGTQGYLFTKANPIQRIMLIIGSIMLLFPEVYTDFIGIVSIVVVVVWQKNMVSRIPKISKSNAKEV